MRAKSLIPAAETNHAHPAVSPDSAEALAAGGDMFESSPIYPPDPARAARTNCGSVAAYEAMLARSRADPDTFWGEIAGEHGALVGLVAGVPAQEPVGDAPADRVELDAAANGIAGRRRLGLGGRAHV